MSLHLLLIQLFALSNAVLAQLAVHSIPGPKALATSNPVTVQVPLNYDLEFYINPTGIQPGWGSIFHYSQQAKDCCDPGNRMPALWFHPGSTQLYVVADAASQGNWLFSSTVTLPMKTFTKINIRAQGRSVKLFINDKENNGGITPSDRVSGKASFYSADPWYTPAIATIKDYVLRDLDLAPFPQAPSSLSQYLAVQSLLPSTTLAASSPSNVEVPPSYDLEFYINPSGFQDHWASIVHYSRNAKDGSDPGDRMPAIWFHPGTTRLHVRIGSATEWSWGIDATGALPLNTFAKINIRAQGRVVKLFINDEENAAGTAPSDRPFGPAKFYRSNPWYPPAIVTVKDYVLRDLDVPAPVTKPLVDVTGASLATQSMPIDVVVPQDFEIDFVVTPRGIVADWSNIIHYTSTGASCCNFGDRAPAVWFWPGSTRIHAVFGSKVDGNWNVNPEELLPINVSTRVTLRAQGRDVQILFNGTSVLSATAPADRPFGKASFYASDPWNPPIKGTIQKYSLTAYAAPAASLQAISKPALIPPVVLVARPVVAVAAATPVAQSKPVDVVVPQDYEIDFIVTPRELVANWSNIVHYTSSGKDCCDGGDRIPAIWFWPLSTRMHIVFGSKTDGNWHVNLEKQLPLNAATRVTVRAQGRAVQIFFNGTSALSATAPSDRPFGKALFYASDPWYAPMMGTVQNYTLKSLQPLIATSTVSVVKPAVTPVVRVQSKPAVTRTTTVVVAKPAVTSTTVSVAKPAASSPIVAEVKPAVTSTTVSEVKPAVTSTNVSKAKPAAATPILIVPQSVVPEPAASLVTQSKPVNVTVPQDFEIDFVVTPRGIVSELSNIVHYTSSGKDCCNVGDRQPGIWFGPASTRLYVNFGAKTDGNWYVESKQQLPLNAATRVTVRAQGRTVQILFNGTSVLSATAPSDRPFGQALFYGSNPWYPPIKGTVENYSLKALSTVQTVAPSPVVVVAKPAVATATTVSVTKAPVSTTTTAKPAVTTTTAPAAKATASSKPAVGAPVIAVAQTLASALKKSAARLAAIVGGRRN